MSNANSTEACMIQKAREEYFAGKITAGEYLRRVLPAVNHERRLSDQFARLFERAFVGGETK